MSSGSTDYQVEIVFQGRWRRLDRDARHEVLFAEHRLDRTYDLAPLLGERVDPQYVHEARDGTDQRQLAYRDGLCPPLAAVDVVGEERDRVEGLPFVSVGHGG